MGSVTQDTANPGTSAESGRPLSPGLSLYPSAAPNADLAKLVAAWPSLPEAMRRAVLAIVEASAPQTASMTSTELKGVDTLDTLHPGFERDARAGR